MNEIREFQEKLRSDLIKSYKPSKQLIELRQKQVALGKMKKYNEAEKLKSQGDSLENWERSNKETGVIPLYLIFFHIKIDRRYYREENYVS